MKRKPLNNVDLNASKPLERQPSEPIRVMKRKRQSKAFDEISNEPEDSEASKFEDYRGDIIEGFEQPAEDEDYDEEECSEENEDSRQSLPNCMRNRISCLPPTKSSSNSRPLLSSSSLTQSFPLHPKQLQGTKHNVLIEDIDKRREGDPIYASLYAGEAYSFLRTLQFRYGNTSVPILAKHSHRGLLVDWIVEVVEELGMSSDVLYLSVNIIDRVLKLVEVSPSKFQLLGMAAMLLASKFEDVFAPCVEDFVQICDESFSRDEILEMERYVLKLLDYRLMAATTKPFLRRFQRAAKSSLEEKNLSNYLSELTLPASYFLRFTPSLIAACSVYFARFLLYNKIQQTSQTNNLTTNFPFWTQELQFYSGYSESELAFLSRKLWVLLCEAPQHVHFSSIYRRYQTKEKSEVSRFRYGNLGEYLPKVSVDSIQEGGR